ncbi:MAG: alpha-galactosidase [Actinomycetota bacterium]
MSSLPSSSASARLTNGGVDFYLEVINGALVIRYWGCEVSGDLKNIPFQRSVANSDYDQVQHPGIMREHSRGWLGYPSILGHRHGTAWSTQFSVTSLSSENNSFTAILEDESAALSLCLNGSLDDRGILKASYELTNNGEPYVLNELFYWLPLSDRATQTLDFAGRWSNERNPQRKEIAIGRWVRDSHEGRSGHNYTIGEIALNEFTNFGSGEAWAVSLAWSGDSQYCVEKNYEGVQSIGAAEVLLPGEVILHKGESYKAPELFAWYSNRGLDGLAQNLHAHLRARSTHPRKPRPLTLNMWEAIYFDHNESKVRELVDIAAEIGVERVVLDDGWFGSRRNDRSGLGDWTISKEMWPHGLSGIVDYVFAKKMEFGLWFEGEMVNPDSDLYRAHPEWILNVDGRVPPTWRHELVLNLDNPEAFNHVLNQTSEILAPHKISYIKWDHNRTLIDAGSNNRPAIRKQTAALYRLFAELKKRHAGLEIESCASGGGRIDLGIIDLVDRFWTSDNNDALERQTMQRWTMQFIPPELLGTHIGSDPGHQTGRHLSLAFRAATALFGHAGLERDLTKLNQEELALLKNWIEVYKSERTLLHSGDVVRMDYPDSSHYLHGVINKERSEALLSFVQLRPIVASHAPKVNVRGLKAGSRYKVDVLSVAGNAEFMAITPPPWIATGAIMTGSELENVGLPAPILRPENALLIKIKEA